MTFSRQLINQSACVICLSHIIMYNILTLQELDDKISFYIEIRIEYISIEASNNLYFAFKHMFWAC